MLSVAGLPSADVEHLQLLLSEWQLLADLAFADLLMWARDTDGDVQCIAQVRPTTGPTAYREDLIGSAPPDDLAPMLRAALGSSTEPAPGQAWFPVRRRASEPVIAVLTRVRRTPPSGGDLEAAYQRAGDQLMEMVGCGLFPSDAGAADLRAGPRAGDGLLLLDGDGIVEYASPNAISAYRRLGLVEDLIGTDFAAATRPLIRDSLEAEEVVRRIRAALAGDHPHRIEGDGHAASVRYRLLPLAPCPGRPGGSGALILIRDVTDVRRRDRQLLSKDATIREIHHRVKNNLQTVAALLRLQARRVEEPQLRIALTESVRRVNAIALVHDTLSMSIDESVEFDDVVDRLSPMLIDVAAPQSLVRFERLGWFGVLPAEVATPLALVLAELLQNAVEHAYPEGAAGVVSVIAQRVPGELSVEITDSGIGLPPGFDPRSSGRLGLQIARTLIETELRGRIELGSRGDDGSGTRVSLTIPLRPRRK